MTVIDELHESWSDEPEAADKLAALEADVGQETTYEEISDHLGWTYVEVRDDMKLLERAGLVSTTKGSRGSKSRVRWLVSPEEVARIAKGGYPRKPTTSMSGSAETSNYGRENWSWEDALAILSSASGVPSEDILIDVKVGPLRSNLARVHGVDERDIEIRIGG